MRFNDPESKAASQINFKIYSKPIINTGEEIGVQRG